MIELDQIPKTIFNSVLLSKNPVLIEKEFAFPSDPTTISGEELSALLLKITAWRSYSLRQLALVNTKRESLKIRYERTVRKYMLGDTKGKTKDKIIAEAHASESGLDDVEDQLKAAWVEENTWQKILEIYSIQMEAVSKELSRRSAELRSLGR